MVAVGINANGDARHALVLAVAFEYCCNINLTINVFFALLQNRSYDFASFDCGSQVTEELGV